MRKFKFILAALVGAMGLVLSGGAQASLLGANVSVEGFNFDGVYTNTATVGSGVEFNLPCANGAFPSCLIIDIGADTITLGTIGTPGVYFTSGDYLNFTGLNTGTVPMDIVGILSKDSVFDVVGFTASTLSLAWTARSTNFYVGDEVTIKLDLAAVPLPAGGLLLASGLAGLVLLRRRKSA